VSLRLSLGRIQVNGAIKASYQPSLVLIRHGQTFATLAGRLMGWTDSPLTEEALRETDALATSDRIQQYKDHVQKIYSSDIGRARTTAYGLAFRLQVPVELNADLRERNFGVYATQDVDELHRTVPQWNGIDVGFNARPSGGESLADVERRVFSYILKIDGEVDERMTLILVGHSTAWRLVNASLLDRRKYPLQEPIPPCLTTLIHPRQAVKKLLKYV
jgi:broad specificity phosphatase PhoE